MSRGRRAPELSAQAELDRAMMARALHEARKGRPSPNPHVGAVVARGARVISVGHHPFAGGPHAEVVALRAAGKRARGATLYVTLEPCNHHGRTPPCTDAVIASGVARVVTGCADPAVKVRGGRARLRRAGIEVVSDVREAEARAQVADFTKFTLKQLPYVTLKAAVTLDGRIAARSGDSRWISSVHARRYAHRMRADSDAVLVGAGTVEHDDPQLTVRMVRGPQPLRVVLDPSLRTPLKSQLARVSASKRTLIFHAKDASERRKRALLARGVELVEVRSDRHGRLVLRAVLRELWRRNVVRLLVEGGSRVHGAFLESGLADHLAVVVAARVLADPGAIPLASGAPKRRLSQAFTLLRPNIRRIGPDVLVQGDLAR
ncbi:MAG TPA: bifunctional diaminohydroxyphosphoribosylaminopyrimidine deaminase/5-amino-6-(5-phosphoribosylamino)uracil reductase RibD [Polyangiales bacterium]|nr:bifunctional diaminohydroxyphosphoribosylaminopyrimidine deaminase/5-amino-6-(5-phosphoribosylamino)uracil reductase RibD [Polyangiales bacterium]